MNRFKKEIRKRGFKLNSDYPCLPFYIKGKSFLEPGYILIDNVYVNSAEATVTQFLNIANVKWRMMRNGKIEMIDMD